MDKIFACGDLHLNHSNLLKPEYDNRPFDTVEEMNETFIANWNSVVSDDDVVLNMGDFTMGKITTIDDYTNRFNGKMVLVSGNHEYHKKLNRIRKVNPDIIIVRHLEFEHNGVHFWCAHNPEDNWFNLVDWSNPSNLRLDAHWHSQADQGLQYNWHGTPWSRGHEHQTPTKTGEVYLTGFSYCVSVDVINFTPINLDQICEEVMEKRKELGI